MPLLSTSATRCRRCIRYPVSSSEPFAAVPKFLDGPLSDAVLIYLPSPYFKRVALGQFLLPRCYSFVLNFHGRPGFISHTLRGWGELHNPQRNCAQWEYRVDLLEAVDKRFHLLSDIRCIVRRKRHVAIHVEPCV